MYWPQVRFRWSGVPNLEVLLMLTALSKRKMFTFQKKTICLYYNLSVTFGCHCDLTMFLDTCITFMQDRLPFWIQFCEFWTHLSFYQSLEINMYLFQLFCFLIHLKIRDSDTVLKFCKDKNIYHMDDATSHKVGWNILQQDLKSILCHYLFQKNLVPDVIFYVQLLHIKLVVLLTIPFTPITLNTVGISPPFNTLYRLKSKVELGNL